MTRDAFLESATHGEEAAVLEALSTDPGLARARNDAGVSVICLAVYAGRLPLARKIAARRDDLDAFEAACIGDAARVRALLDDGMAIDATSPDGFSTLGYAAYFGHPELLEALLAAGADVNAPARNPMRVQPLHSAAAHSDQARAAALARPLLQAGADPNARQQGGFTPLHEAALNGNAELIALLLGHGADPELANDDDKSARDLAGDAGHAGLFDTS